MLPPHYEIIEQQVLVAGRAVRVHARGRQQFRRNARIFRIFASHIGLAGQIFSTNVRG